MSHLHQDNINRHISLKAQTHFHTICNVWVITPHSPTQQFGMRIFVHEKTSAPAPGTSSYASNTTLTPLILCAPYHAYARGVPSRHAYDAAYHPYACIVPARHASNAAYHPYTRSALLKCLQRSLPSLCPWIPSLHASHAAYHPYTRSDLQTCLQHRLPSLHYQCPPDMPLMPPSHWPNPQGHLPSLCSGTTSIGYGGLLAYMMHAIREIC
ncbi:hypothetical protein O181_093178 [Austropuccinia psidii MF-1]|uniref:Uncharacterized protein n=1 Tax=Austropuccinia psidii MF-1 TaxID=1389203 RepID=A0A9Q3IZU7_9BASI|nr:hypothetical protein [Austropuccinia psidii MF-1]